MTLKDLTRPVPLTVQELAELREQRVQEQNELCRTPEIFTCDDCLCRFTCTLVFDGYNTDGDCLAEK